MKRINAQRRGFLKRGALAATGLALGAWGRLSSGQEEKPRLDEKEAEAERLGYKHDASRVDNKKFPTYKPGEACGNCQFFQGKAGTDEWAPCPMFPGKRVNVKGWCSSYMKRTST